MKPEEEIKNKNPFRVPDGYFETLSGRIIDTVHASEEMIKHDTVKKTLFRRLRPYIALAAILTGFAIITLSVIKLTSVHNFPFLTAENSASIMDDVINEEIDVYLIENEIVTPSNNQAANSVAEYDLNENIILENLEVTDIYNL